MRPRTAPDRLSRHRLPVLLLLAPALGLPACSDDGDGPTGATPRADVAVALSGETTARVGRTTEVVVTVDNVGPDAATDVVVSLDLPAGVDPLTTSSGGVEVETGITWPPVALLPAGESRNFSATVLAEEAGSGTFRARSISATPDPDPSNNDGTGGGSVLDVAFERIIQADLAVALRAPATAHPGGELDYAVVVRNLGPDPAEEVTARLELRSGQQVVGTSQGGTEEAGAVTWSTGATLATGDSLVVTARTTVPFLGPLLARASATATTPDPIAVNNTGGLEAARRMTRVGLETLYQIGGGADRFFFKVALVGDLDGDGLRDMVVGDPSRPAADERSGAGAVYAFSAADGRPLWERRGEVGGGSLGWDVEPGDDLDGDGIEDVLVGRPGILGSEEGSVLVLSGRSGSVLRIMTLGEPNDGLGASVALVNDLSGDGARDLAVGAPGARGPEGMTGAVRIFSPSSGIPIHTHFGLEVGEAFGYLLANIGDVDGDGDDELAVSRGTEMVVIDPATGAVVTGPLAFRESPAAGSGPEIRGLPDMDGDGLPELFLPDNTASNGAGRSRILSGDDGTLLLEVTGTADAGFLGPGGWAGDVDDDGVPDVVVGAWGNDDGELNGGKVLVYGGADGELLLNHVGTLSGIGLGRDVLTLDDLDGDGVREMLVLGWGGEESPGGVLVVLKGVRVE